jgi:hypothetical protein
MAIQAFTVLSEFRFDVGHAVVGSETLQNKIQGVSDAAANAQSMVKQIGIGFVQNLSGMQSGMLGLLGNATMASDKFSQSQLSFASIIDSNMNHLTGNIDTLNAKMLVSQNIMNDIAKDASKFGLPAGELLEMTKGLSAMLVPKGLAGDNFSNARTMSRNLLKSAPNLGVHPSEVQGQLLRSIEGSASMGDTLFRRLLSEAPESFRAAKVKDAKGFNALDTEKRFNILNTALNKFASNAGILELRANTLGGTLQRVRDLFSGFNSVLKPLGDVLIPFIVKVLNMAIDWINTKGRVLIQSMANFLKPFLEDPKKLFVQAQQVMDAGKNFKLAGEFTGLFILFTHLKEILHVVGRLGGGRLVAWLSEIPLVRMALSGLGGLFRALWAGMGLLWPILRVVIWGIAEFAVGVAAFLIPLQGLSGALARVKLEVFEWFADNLVSLTDLFMRMKDALSVFFMPIQDMVQGFEELFFWILSGTYVLDFGKAAFKEFVGLLEFIAPVFLELYAAFRGLIAGMFDVVFRFVENLGIIIGNLLDGKFLNPLDGTKNLFGGYMQAGAEEFEKVMQRGLNPNQQGGVDNNKVSNHNHNYDVKMTNNFKEVLQPDRIAYTIVDQLKKASTNRTGSKNTSGTAGRLQEST